MTVHFIAIGGSVMHQLAIALLKKGYTVQGSDDEIFEPAASKLAQSGLMPEALGWYPQKITPALDAVILGMHAKADNPELGQARLLGLKIYSFPEYIYQESLHKTRVVIGGSHGKTTTTSMIMHVLRVAGKKFDYLVGARLQGFDQSVQITDAPIIICEGDEYPASAVDRRPKFHFLFPDIAVLTGIAWDHINVFPTAAIYLEQFAIFIQQMKAGGLLIFNQTDATLSTLVQARGNHLIRQGYGIPMHRIEDGKTVVVLDDSEAELSVFGDHNLLNLEAARLVTKALGVDTKMFLRAMHHFEGADRRLELLERNEQTIVYRDFAHAPSKVKATNLAVKQQFPQKKLISVLELHTYSSLNEAFMQSYEGAMQAADMAIVFYSQHALALKGLPPLNPQKVMDGFSKSGMIVITDKADLTGELSLQSYENAVLLLMSSGNFDGWDIFTFAKQITHSFQATGRS